ncbi:GntR family transcriptional regulator [Clostridium pasteurianum DSM 525 = ATCC 6013]|uniref:GntR family transcriptional regulator n=2 Tax=Clostridium pasteurianum TaxID=1501 RepID=A0A0H3J7C0_CLOPA|nr:GntR family transcriptional regulator [Clostridium pasteurianum DSM 525 = ATCC 6013]AJA53799.1 GntR family transcriptional regulator [Clostridium pasteurianum DSM 525 = ATCC 6013]KRU14176.1 transcriptional regulator, GntR family [Clostridium pasteurianum DSM 525 = ATCC 6013]
MLSFMIFDKSIPIYIQISEYIKSNIINGKLKSGEKLPSIRKLANELRVNINTVSRAYYELKLDEIIYVERKGLGYFVTSNNYIINKLKLDSLEKITEIFINNIINLRFSNDEIIYMVKQRMINNNSTIH